MLTHDDEDWRCQSDQEEQEQPGPPDHTQYGQAEQSEGRTPHEGRRFICIGHEKVLRYHSTQIRRTAMFRTVRLTVGGGGSSRRSFPNQKPHASRVCAARYPHGPPLRSPLWPCVVKGRDRRLAKISVCT